MYRKNVFLNISSNLIFKYIFSSAFFAFFTYNEVKFADAAQISVTDGTAIIQNGGNFDNISNLETGSALYAANSGSIITGTDLVIGPGSFPNMETVRAKYGGTINLYGNTIITGWGLSASNDAAITMEGGSINVNLYGARASYNSTITLKDVAVVVSSGNQSAVQALNSGVINLIGGSVTTQGTGTAVALGTGGTVTIDGTRIETVGAGANGIYNQQASKSANVTLDARNFVIDTFGYSAYGLHANSYGTSVLQNGIIHTRGERSTGIGIAGTPDVLQGASVSGDYLTIITEGLNAHGVLVQTRSATVNLTNTDITVNRAYGIYADDTGVATLNTGTIRLNGTGGSAAIASRSSSITLNNVDVRSDYAGVRGFYASSQSVVSVSDSTLIMTGADAYGIVAQSIATVNVENTDLQLTGTNAVGIVLYGANTANKVNVTGGSISVPNGMGIVTVGGIDTVTLVNTSLTSNVLIAGDSHVSGATQVGARLTVNATGTTLSGAAYVDALSSSNIVLDSGSEWTLTDATVMAIPQSEVSTLTVNDSTVGFGTPVSGRYQTLVVGSGVVDAGVTAVYSANNATLKLNSYMNEGGALSNQFTDRLLVNGDVAGATTVIVTPVAGSPGGNTSISGSNQASEGISIIQVSGDAAESSFQLLGGYVTAVGMPYQYSLHAYGPGSVNGAADESQRLVSGTDPFWDYRLQSVYVEPVDPIDPIDPIDPVNPVDPGNPDKPGGGNTGGPSITPPKVRAVAPQVANYLIAPTALFHAGLQDIGNLHKRLGEIRDDRVTGRNGGKGEFFMRAYGGMYDYKSNRNAYSYGYDANIDYAAVQLGGSLYAFESKNSVTRFGVAASIGSLSFDPKNVRGTTSTKLDTWSVSAYGTYLHDSGWYVDGIVSYGAFDGNVSTTYRGKTASLSGTSFSASLETGYPFQLGNGLVLEPQAQVIYQRLMFDRKLDTDMFTVSLGTLDQVTARVGARLSKTFAQPEQDRLITVYAKANVLHTFGSDNKVFLGDTFRIGDFGTSIEGGVGINATLSKNVSLYGEVSYQHRIGKSGVSGVSATGGLRYAF